jgi:quinol monooxygenase YgiN
MTIISKDSPCITFINIFHVDPLNQQKLIELLSKVTNESVRNTPGFISSSLHKSLDGKKVTMYAQWRSMDEYQKMRENPQAAPVLQEALKIASFESGVYQVVENFTGISNGAS